MRSTLSTLQHQEAVMWAPRIYNAVCEVLESYAARLRTETLEAELDAVDWALMGSDEDDD
jgi:hypothetical protein